MRFKKQKTKKPQNGEKTVKQKRIHYSMLTFVLLICIVQLSFSAIQNINKNISFSSKVKNLEAKRDQELLRNKQLKSEIENFDSEATLESIARNNLKMAGEDEILIIINKPNEDNKTDDNKKRNKFFNFFHKKTAN